MNNNVCENDELRLTWNVWPLKSNNSDIIPIACLYGMSTPCAQIKSEPIFCLECKSVLFPESVIDSGSMVWQCVFCNAKNRLCLQNDEESMMNLSCIMKTGNSTIEYIMDSSEVSGPKFFLLVDVCTYDEERHELMKKGVLKMLEEMPEDAVIGVIEFGTNIELLMYGAEDEFETRYCFSGEKAYNRKDIQGIQVSDIRNFMMTKKDAGDVLKNKFNELKPDPFPVMNGFRPRRCTGAALSFAINFLEENCGGLSVKYVIFTQGPCTVGPGRVCGLEMSENRKDTADLGEAKQFYQEIAEKMNLLGHSADVIAGTIADIGVECFKPILSLTGGTLIMAQDFDQGIFLGSIEKLMEKDEAGVLKCGFNAKTQVQTSHNVAFRGIVGSGKAESGKWRLGSIGRTTNLTVLLDKNEFSVNGKRGYVQILTQYTRSDRRIVLRATTFGRLFSSNEEAVSSSFDQVTACVFQARAFIAKGYQNVMDFESAIDKNLIKFVRRYSVFSKNVPNSVMLPASMAYFPNFMYFFRRSLLVQTDGISQDESAYFKLFIFNLDAYDAIKMIKPALISFNYQKNEPFAVELDVSSLRPETFLVLDSFHNVLLWKGSHVSEWIKNDIHKNPDYKHIGVAWECAQNYSLSLCDRLPVPQYKVTEEGESQARILLHYVNPGEQGIIDSEKIDYNKFYDTLCRTVVRQE